MGTAYDLLKKGETSNRFKYFNIVNLNECYDYYQQFAEMLISVFSPESNIFNKKKINNLSFNYLWKKSVNAGSLEKEEEDRISVNEGTILQVYNLFYKLNTRTNVIECSTPLVPCNEIRGCIYYTNKKEPEKPIITEMICSDDVNRNNIAEYMAMFAIKWIIAHEIGHAYNGHTNYYLEVRDKIKTGHLSENELETLYLDLQTLEMDADSFAINKVVDEAMGLYNNNDKICSILKNPKDVLKLVTYAIHGVFYIFREYDLISYRKKEHPPAFVRECIVLNTVKTYLNKYYFEQIGSDYCAEDIAKIEQLISCATGREDLKYLNYVCEFGDEATQYVKKIMDNYWNNIKYKIKEFSRLPIESIDF